MQKQIERAAGRLLTLLLAEGLRVSFAESCTGGLAAAAFTACPGASAALEMSFVTYCDRAKAQLLAVPPAMLARHTAVSAPVARAMALGAQKAAGADLALAVTGLAGPGADELGRQPGLVYLAAAFGIMSGCFAIIFREIGGWCVSRRLWRFCSWAAGH